jgi:hypothetical protein
MRSVRVKELCRAIVASLLLWGTSVSAGEYGKWIPSSNYMNAKSFEKPISIAKEWAENNIDAESEKFNLGYHAVKATEGYVVYIDPIYPPNENGEQLIVSDDEWCVFINNQNEIENVEQCLSP